MGQNRQAQFRDIYGGTMRSMDPILLEIYNKKIACDLLSAAKQDKAMMPDVQLRTIENDGLITFAIDNNSKDSCYVNVLAVNDALGTVSLCIVPTPDMEENILLLPPAQTMDLYMFQFVKQPETRYLLVSLPISYTPSQIQALLRHPEDLECKTK